MKNKLFAFSTEILRGEVPTEIEILPIGKWKGYKDRSTGETIEIEVTKDDALAAIAFRKSQIERYPDRDLVIDYEHQTMYDVQAPAAGWMGELFLRGDAVWAKINSWTEKAAEYLQNREYRYFSPVFAFGESDRETGETIRLMIKNGALTKEPFLDSMSPVVAKDKSEVSIYYLTNKPIKGDLQMPTVQEILQYLAELLGIDAGSTWDTIKSKLDAIKTGADTVTAKYKSAMEAIGLKAEATVDDVKTFAAKHKSILDALGVQATATVDEIKNIIAAKGSSHPIDMKNYVLKSDYESLAVQMKEMQIEPILAKHMNRGALHLKEQDAYRSDYKNNLRTLKDIDELLSLRPDYSIIPLQEIKLKDHKPDATGEQSVEVIKEYAAKNNVSFRDAAIAMSKKK